MTFDFSAVRDILKCPRSRTDLVLDHQGLVCVDVKCRLRFEIRDDIPIMLVDEAQELSPQQWASVMQVHGRPTT